MIISSTELQNNFGKYLMLAAQEDIVITRNGLEIAKLTAIKESQQDIQTYQIGTMKKHQNTVILERKLLLMSFFTYNSRPMKGTSILTEKSTWSLRQKLLIKSL
ncbi:MAG: prevent-host-death protein [Neobacillus sp.]|nr:prevent-host-death protein [Neobacillus sp.]